MEFISSISKLLDIMNWFIVLVATFCFYDCCTALTCEYYSSLKNEEEEHPCTEEVGFVNFSIGINFSDFLYFAMFLLKQLWEKLCQLLKSSRNEFFKQ